MNCLLIDASSLAYAAAYTLGDLTHEDVPTGVIYGFLSRLLFLGNKFRTNDIVLCWDAEPKKRKAIYPDYKANRKTSSLPPDQKLVKDAIHQQLDVLRLQVAPNLGMVNSFIQEGLEADDVIAKITKGGLRDEFVIVSPDDDLLQLLCEGEPRVIRYSTTKKKITTAETFRLQHGISPRDWAKVKAIAGCSSDNVEGIRGVGEKRATDYLKGTLKPESVAYKAIKNGQEIIFRNKALVLLPFESTQAVELAEAGDLDPAGITRVAIRWGMDSFLDDARVEAWRKFCEGDFGGERRSSIEQDLEMRPPQRKRDET